MSDPRQPDAARDDSVGASLSPYVRAHADAPVPWRPWGPAALDAARAESRPVFLSIGYSTCYWCHAMARESFAEPAIAEALEPFVCVVVDREERPDVDEVYMAATQLLTHRGGWPNSLFLTPDLVPYFAGTYFPPLEVRGQPGFYQVARSMADAWERRRDEVHEQGAELAPVMARYLAERGEPGADVPGTAAVAAVVAALAERFDDAHGGFGRTPKFPPHASLWLLTAVTGEVGAGLDAETRERAATMLSATLDRMARGGVHDQVGGGFHRYATDREWRIPQLEKTLADNALLLEVYARRAAAGDEAAARVARGIAGFLERELATPEGGFRTAVSADEHDPARDGAYHAWTAVELRAALGAEDHAFLAPLFGCEGPPFFEERFYVLHQPLPLGEQAARRQMTEAALWREVAPLLGRLRAARERRPRPWVEPKVLADANGMAIAALATAGRLLDEPSWIEGASAASAFADAELHGPDGLAHLVSDGRRGVAAFLADYAHLVRGYVALAAAGERRWLTAAADLADEMTRRLGDGRGDGDGETFRGFFTAAPDPYLRWRVKDAFDAALPAANGVAALALAELAAATGEPRWHRLATATLRAFAGTVERQPEAARSLATAALVFGSGG